MQEDGHVGSVGYRAEAGKEGKVLGCGDEQARRGDSRAGWWPDQRGCTCQPGAMLDPAGSGEPQRALEGGWRGWGPRSSSAAQSLTCSPEFPIR